MAGSTSAVQGMPGPAGSEQATGLGTRSGTKPKVPDALTSDVAKVLQLLPPWLKCPDYSKVDNVNALVARIWPYLADATEKLVHEQLDPWARDFVAQKGRGILVGLHLDVFDLGPQPLRLEAVKAYRTEEDELILEGPLAWASSLRVRLIAEFKLPLLRRTIKVPLELANLQVRVSARITARPIMETPPFLGSVTVTLLEQPHLDFDLPVALPASLVDPLAELKKRGANGGTNGHAAMLDLMALPLVDEGFRMAASMVARAMIMYPKGYTVELVPGGSQRQWPQGMLDVWLIKITGLRDVDLLGLGDPCCVLQVREGRVNVMKPIKRHPELEFDDVFAMVVDSVEKQSLRLVVKDQEWGRIDRFLGAAELPLKNAPFILCPGMRVPLTMALRRVREQRATGLLSTPLNLLFSTGRLFTEVLEGPTTDHVDQPTYSRAGATAGAPTGDAEGASSGRYYGSREPTVEPDYVDSSGRGGRDDRGGREGLRPQRSSSSPQLTGLDSDATGTRDARGKAAAGRGGEGSGDSKSEGSGAEAAGRLPGQQERMRERQQGEQTRSLAAMGDKAQRAVHAGHRDEDEVEAVVDYMRQKDQQQQQQQQQGEQGMQAAQVCQQPAGPGQQGAEDRQQSAFAAKEEEEEQPGKVRQEQQQQLQQQEGQEGRKGAQPSAEITGTAFIEVVWTPFKQPDVAEAKPGFGSGLGPPLAFQWAAQQQVEPSDKGILTVTLVRAVDLKGSRGVPDPYVKFVVRDKLQRKQQKQRSTIVYNEPHPRWNERYDFVLISAGSVLVVSVMDKATPADRLMALKLVGALDDEPLGHVRIGVQRVAASGRIKHVWPLVGAEQGAIELILEWFPASAAEL